jgi:hypothetical protein
MNRHARYALAITLFGANAALAQQAPAPEPLATAVAAAGPCARPRSSPRAPIELSLGAAGVPSLADFGSTPSACGYSGFSVGGRMGLLIATSAFYGAIDAEAALSGTYRIDEDSWVTLAIDAVRYRTVINASVVTAPIDLGATTITVHHALATDADAQVTLFLRALLPTELGNRFVARIGLEPGFSFVFSPHRRWSLHGGVSLPVTAAVSAAGTSFTFTPARDDRRRVAPGRPVRSAARRRGSRGLRRLRVSRAADRAASALDQDRVHRSGRDAPAARRRALARARRAQLRDALVAPRRAVLSRYISSSARRITRASVSLPARSAPPTESASAG